MPLHLPPIRLARVSFATALSLSLWSCAPAPPLRESPQTFTRATKLPAAPPGYEWYECKNGVGSFLRPHGWFVKEETVKNTNALFITKRAFEPPERFDIGLTVNQITRFTRHHPIPPSLYAKAFIATKTERMEVISTGTVKSGVADMHIARVRGSNKGVMTIVHYIAVGMDEQDALYLVFFEAPEKDWEEELLIAGTMLEKFGLGPPHPAARPPDQAARSLAPIGPEPGWAS